MVLHFYAHEKQAWKEAEAKLREEKILLTQRLDKSHEISVRAAQRASAQLASLQGKLYESDVENHGLSADVQRLKGQRLADERVIVEQAEKIKELEKREISL